MFALVNQERQRSGRSVLKWDESLARVARSHSEAMRRTGIIEGNEGVKDQAQAARPGVKVRFNVGRALSVDETA